MLTLLDVERAAARIDDLIVHTPVLTSAAIDELIGARVHFKCENLQRMGAFKFRGACNAIRALTPTARARGVVAFTSGNHGLAVSHAARLHGVAATIVMPSNAPAMKVQGARDQGANVILYDRFKEDRAAIARRIVEEQGSSLIPPFDHADVIAGQGTASLELMHQVPDLDAMIVSVGGAGFLAGCTVAAKGLRPSIRMVGAEPEAGNDGEQSLREGRIVTLPSVPQTMCDGQQTQAIGQRPFEILRAHDAQILSASDAMVRAAMRLIFERLKLVAEPSGACALAVLMQHRAALAGQRVGVMISGGNVDLDRWASIMAADAPSQAGAP